MRKGKKFAKVGAESSNLFTRSIVSMVINESALGRFFVLRKTTVSLTYRAISSLFLTKDTLLIEGLPQKAVMHGNGELEIAAAQIFMHNMGFPRSKFFEQ